MKKTWIAAAVGLGVALVLAGILAPFASPQPDGLERVAEDKGFSEAGEGEPAFGGSPMPDYTLPAVEDEAASTRLAGVIGTAIAFALGIAAAVVLRIAARRTSTNQPGPELK